MNIEPASSWVHTNRSKILSWIIALTVMLFIYSFFTQSRKIEAQQDLIEAQSDLMITYRNKDSNLVSYNKVLKVTRANDLLKLKSSDSTIIQLQKLVKDNSDRLKGSGSATVINSQGTINKTTPTVVINSDPKIPNINKVPETNKDTINKFPTYSSSYKDKWVKYDILSSKDSTTLKLKYIDIYSIVVGTEKDQSLPFLKRTFSARKDYAWVTTESPYSEIKSTRTTSITVPPKPRLSVGIQAGYGLTAGTLVTSPYIGIGISYRLFYLPKL